MINRGVTQTSQYFFNTKTGMLEKVENNIQTIESLSNQSITQLDDLTKKINENHNNGTDPINNITVITADDNLIHNYFNSMSVSWDASNCLASAIIKFPKMDVENTNYWITYTGQLTIYAGYNFTFDYVNANSYSTEKDAAESLTKYWDNSDILPFFKGEISRVKEMDNYIVIYVDSIGRRFQQKIPDEFRQSFIYNQNVRDAFQAICEFLGVNYICPPKTVTDNGETEAENEETDTDGTENDINTQQDKEKKIQQIVQNKVNISSSSDLSSNSNDENSNDEPSLNTDNITLDKEVDTPQNGYQDISFDANGAIIHGTTVIETSPDMVETLLVMDENPLEKYLEDETGIVEKVNKFLDGEMFDELHNKVMDYGAITIEPKSTASSEMSSLNDSVVNESTNGNTENSENSENSENESSSVNSTFGNTSSRAREKNGWINGQYYENGRIHLSKEYINSLSVEQAKQKYVYAKSKHIYTDETMRNLLRRTIAPIW